MSILFGAAPSARPQGQVLMAWVTLEWPQKKLWESKLFSSKNGIFIVLKHGDTVEISTIFEAKWDFWHENCSESYCRHSNPSKFTRRIPRHVLAC